MGPQIARQQSSLPAPSDTTWPHRPSANKGEEMQFGSCPDEERIRAEKEMYHANPLRD